MHIKLEPKQQIPNLFHSRLVPWVYGRTWTVFTSMYSYECKGHNMEEIFITQQKIIHN
jgi:hypothetical protein